MLQEDSSGRPLGFGSSDTRSFGEQPWLRDLTRLLVGSLFTIEYSEAFSRIVGTFSWTVGKG